MTEQQQAELLARWLDAGGRGDPPDGLDEDVLEALYVLRPELAPPPRVDVDDILAGVTEGPFAAQPDEEEEGGEVVPFPVPPSAPAQAPLAPPQRDPRRLYLAAGGAGLLAAAAALILVLPNVGDLEPVGASGPMYRSRSVEETTTARTEPSQDASGSAPASTVPPVAAESVASAPAAADLQPAPPPAPARRTPEPEPKRAKEAARTRKDAPTPPAGLEDDAVADALPDEPTEEASGAGADPTDRESLQSDGYATGNTANIDEDANSLRALGYAETTTKEARQQRRSPAKREAAESEAAPVSAPASDVPEPSERATTDDALARAALLAQRDPSAAARSLSDAIRAPAADGVRVALAATRYALDGGAPADAATYAKRGLALGGTPSQRKELQALLARAVAAE